MARKTAGRGREESRPRRVMPWGDLPRATETAADGLLLVDKPPAVTSHDVVGAVRRLAGTRKVGHAGTLDPMATGLLIIGIGRATKLLTYITGATKSYDATVALGLATTSDDADGDPISIDAVEGARRQEVLSCATPESIELAMAQLRGDIQQVPSSVSALKIDGKRAHDLVRAGQSVELQARPVHVTEFARTSDLTAASATVDGFEADLLTFDVHASVSSGTYIRALARDLGNAHGRVGAHLRSLRRTRIGDFDVVDSHDIPHLADMVAGGAKLPVTPLAQAARRALPTVDITEKEAVALSYGQFIDRRASNDGRWPAAAFTPDGAVVAVVSKRGNKLKPDLLLQSS